MKEAYNAKKWAFVSDYARFDILYRYSGLYFDTDVELIKLIEDIVAKEPFMGFELIWNRGNFKMKIQICKFLLATIGKMLPLRYRPGGG